MTEVETTSTTLAQDGAPNVAAGTDAPTPAAPTTPNGTPTLSAYKQRLQEVGREGIGCEVPLELAEMMRAAAKKQDDIALSAWMRQVWAKAVNAAELTHKVAGEDGVEVEQPWTFDLSRLEETKSRTSTRNLTPEQKAEKAEAAKKEAQDQRSLVKRLLEEHRAKAKAGAQS